MELVFGKRFTKRVCKEPLRLLLACSAVPTIGDFYISNTNIQILQQNSKGKIQIKHKNQEKKVKNVKGGLRNSGCCCRENVL